MKKLATLAGCLLIASMAGGQEPAFLKGPFEEALKLAKTQNKPILIEFHQRGG